MSRYVKYIEDLFFYDIPEVFVGEDQIGCFYMCYLLSEGVDGFRYLCTPVRRKDINDFKFGKTSLRDIFLESKTKEYYTCKIIDFSQDSIPIELYKEELTEDILPGKGFILDNFDTSSNELVTEAKKRNTALIKLAIEVPEAEEILKIETNKLSNFLSLFQKLIYYAYRKVVITSSNKKEKNDLNIYSPTMYVSGFANGSFIVEFEPLKETNLFGQSKISGAFRKLDEVTSEIKEPEKALEIIQKNKGHLANTYIKLLQYMVKTETGLRYNWAEPADEVSHMRTINYKEINPLLNALSGKNELLEETVSLTGKIIKADSKRNQWTIANEEDGKDYSGGVAPGSFASLSGIVIDNKRYLLECKEKIEETTWNGDEKKTLYLINYKEI
ncbi:MAG: hypothetical protein HQL05_03435 [Nitrospirae bacterium]|uniref:DUF6575 domain-containing protein n=1 Tax=Candidatus Magnetobacterium casense TaxID=1455061 RepID=UPI00058ADDD2|nr:DUF6575 domain-containing protein [Candidatus Magnetobacterium casensis]MBF0336861.1 hypothetical protein [Nitrospirota bacterium]